MFFENYCKVLLSIDKKVFYREQWRMRDNNVTDIVVGKTSWKNAHYISHIIIVVETPRPGLRPENTNYKHNEKSIEPNGSHFLYYYLVYKRNLHYYI